MSRRKRALIPSGDFEAVIASLSHEGRGICYVDDKPVFVDGGLPGETIRFKYQSMHSKYAEGRVVDLINKNKDRITEKCQHASICGGCSLQHMSEDAQIQLKQNHLLEQLTHFGKVKPEEVLAPLQAKTWGYRRKARLGVKYVIKKQKMMVGFREKHSRLLADISHCEVLDPKVARLIEPLKALISKLSVMQKIPQIEIAKGDDATVLIFRHLEQMTTEDRHLLREFADTHDIHVYLQPNKMNSIYRLWPLVAEPEMLHTTLKSFDLTYEFYPTDFVQVNESINELMLHRVIDYLDLTDEDVVLDLFCGLGNITLPIAKTAKHVTGVEGSDEMVKRGLSNAKLNSLTNVEFYNADLQKDCTDTAWFNRDYNKLVIDPARSGAEHIIRQLKDKSFEKIVYVSCNPATLARDAGILVNELGFHLTKAGVMDMFPHTNHVESIAVFEKRDN